MLPFRDHKSKTSRSEEIELDDDDLVILDVEIHARDVPVHDAHASVRASSFATASLPSSSLPSVGSGARRKHTLPPGSRRVVEERVEEDVAGQCLASLAESRARSSSHVRAALARPSAGRESAFPPPLRAGAGAPVSERAPVSVSRLPAVSSPPSRTSIPLSRSRDAEEAPGVRDSSPPPAFVRRSSASFQVATPSSFTGANARPSRVNSLAPVSTSVPSGHHAASREDLAQDRPPEHTLIVVRERPRAAWIFAAAALGALGAVAAISATRFLSSGDATAPGDGRTQAVVTTPSAASPAAGAPALPALPALPPAAVVAPPPPAPVVAPSPAAPARPGPAVMSFADDQGVAIKAPAPRAPASPAAAAPRTPRPAAPTRQGLGPMLPDGSLSLGPSSSSSSSSSSSRVSTNAGPATAPAVAAPAPSPAPVAPPLPSEPPPRKPRALTPEQQLAEAQLKASMK